MIDSESLHIGQSQPLKENEIIEKLLIRRELNIISKVYPILINNINAINSKVTEYNDAVKKNDLFLTNYHNEMNGLIKDIIFDADRSMEELIEIYLKLMVLL